MWKHIHPTPTESYRRRNLNLLRTPRWLPLSGWRRTRESRGEGTISFLKNWAFCGARSFLCRRTLKSSSGVVSLKCGDSFQGSFVCFCSSFCAWSSFSKHSLWLDFSTNYSFTMSHGRHDFRVVTDKTEHLIMQMTGYRTQRSVAHIQTLLIGTLNFGACFGIV